MKKKIIKYGALLMLTIILTLVAVLPMQRGKSNNTTWMSALDNNTSLNSLTIPGTHDSGALHSIAEISGKCQSLSIKEQLKIGVRFLDVRLQLVDNKLKVVHSFTDQMTDFDDVLIDITSFIRNNKSEFLIVSIKEDASPKRSNKQFAEVVESTLLSHTEINRSTTLPQSVGLARGSIYVIARYKNASIGVPCYEGWKDDTTFVLNDIYVQDNYKVASAEEKIADIRKTYGVALDKTHALVLNYTSCYLTSGFPPIYAGLPAHDINSDTFKAISSEYSNGPLGVLVCDFMTSKLASTIIERNLR